ncbi:hypothetical protein BD410DRAFT_898873 [Rickenella mellea]|uniref:Uncharacterized protein n=1 Tax=Rickenella mellea TaxID=50990 RepID=A0A4Y7Q1L8_9AGAM|nr:hypothetical protein BD410DRAFT_898873 [Rickenella mellea]
MGVNLRKRATMMAGAFAVWALAALPGAQAQTTNATCLSTYAFLYNSKGQSPCLVAAYAAGACNGGQYDVSALDVGEHYIGPSTTLVNNCQCSSILYSLMSACGVCQNRTIITWSSWDTNCKNVYLTVYPEDIPSGTAIPAWAYVNVSQSDIFNPNDAMTLSASHDSTASLNQVTQTGAGGANPTNGVTGAKKKSSNTGAIAGGVVGGVVVIALAGLLAFFLIRQRNNKRRNMAPSSQYMAANPVSPGPEMQNFTGGSGGGYSGQQQYGGQQHQQLTGEYNVPQSTGSSAPLVGQRLYDPNDPSTFPSSPAPPTFISQYSGPQQQYGGAPAAPGAYRGAPEL